MKITLENAFHDTSAILSVLETHEDKLKWIAIVDSKELAKAHKKTLPNRLPL